MITKALLSISNFFIVYLGIILFTWSILYFNSKIKTHTYNYNITKQQLGAAIINTKTDDIHVLRKETDSTIIIQLMYYNDDDSTNINQFIIHK